MTNKTNQLLSPLHSFAFFFFICLTGNVVAQTGNYGIGVAAPTTKLDVNGAITNRQGTDVAATTATTFVMPTTLTNSQYRLVASGANPTGLFTITGPGFGSTASLTLEFGARMVLVNNTNFTGKLNGFLISSKQAVEFVYSNLNGTPGWVATNGGGQGVVVTSNNFVNGCGCPNIATVTATAITNGDPINDGDVTAANITTALSDATVCAIAINPNVSAPFTMAATTNVSVTMPSPAAYTGRIFYVTYANLNNITFSTTGFAIDIDFQTPAGFTGQLIGFTNSNILVSERTGITAGILNCVVQKQGAGGTETATTSGSSLKTYPSVRVVCDGTGWYFTQAENCLFMRN